MTTPTAVLAPVRFTAPLTSPQGLYLATMWTGEIGPTRWLDSGVEVRGDNYGGESASGLWDADWCTPPALDGPRKEGERPGILDPFTPITVWSYDECDLIAPSRAEVRQRGQQVFRLEEQTAVEREFAERLLADAVDAPEGIGPGG